MPAGLDGNPDPVTSEQRDHVLDAVVDCVLDLPGDRVLVGVDGRSGAGKSTFADEVSARLAAVGRAVVRSTTDSFHRPRVDRLRRGPTSGKGYFLDSHQLDVIVGELLEPFARGADRVQTAAFDEPSDTPHAAWAEVPEEAVLVFDGLFLLRDELAAHWSLTVFLDADARRDREWLDFLTTDMPAGPSERARELDARLRRARWPRYRDGWQRYLDAADPAARADLVVDNNDVAAPLLAHRR